MRMTNEEFQAEVFRRSNLYLQQKKQNHKKLRAKSIEDKTSDKEQGVSVS